ncbi:hypothetical protein V501_00367 [Pseudogymnoascus sp. VKM F-4519 (FW-2642)]|nr:hypothetical protein V501_00367 [Pseudogymnoascus sp. VKM F-4519 (FW-2642)]
MTVRGSTNISGERLLTLGQAKAETWRLKPINLVESIVQDEVCFIFLENGDWFKNICTEANRRKILEPFQVPDILSSKLCTELNGYFGCRSSLGDEGNLIGLSTWFRILTKRVVEPGEKKLYSGEAYLWYEMAFFALWSTPGTARVLCIGTPLEMRVRIEQELQTRPAFNPNDPFAMLRPILDEVVRACDDDTWRVAKTVRRVEKKRKVRPDFEELYDLARHARHLVEIETVAIETMERMIIQQNVNYELLRTGLDKTYQIQAGEYMAFQLQMMKSLRSRAQATLDRLNGEVALAYNTLASMDNRIMKSVTILAMVFLPATFVAGLFSTTFFSFAENDGWGFSSKFWIYWVVVIPLTAAIVSGWWLWLGESSNKPSLSQVSESKTQTQTQTQTV